MNRTSTTNQSVDRELSIDHIGSTITAAVEMAWAAIRLRHPALSEVVAVLWPASITDGVTYRGYLDQQWGLRNGDLRLGELRIDAELLNEGGEGTFARILHQAAVALALAERKKPLSREDRYHNGEFRTSAMAIGLDVKRHSTWGYSLTRMSSETVEAYADEIAKLNVAIVAYRLAEEQPADESDAAACNPSEPDGFLDQQDATGDDSDASQDELARPARQEADSDHSSAPPGPTEFGVPPRPHRKRKNRFSSPFDVPKPRNGDPCNNAVVDASCGCMDPQRWIKTKRGELQRGNIQCNVCFNCFAETHFSSRVRPVFEEDEGLATRVERLKGNRWFADYPEVDERRKEVKRLRGPHTYGRKGGKAGFKGGM